MVDRVKFIELLGQYRTRCGWTQDELAMKIGVHRNTVVSWENGSRRPQSRGVVLQLADELLLSQEERNAFLEVAGFSIEHWRADYWNVPYQHNPYFVGREDVLQSLRQRLVPGEKATALTQSISGLGGIGKTQVAIEYAHHFGEQYEAVLWIPADSQEVAIAAYLRVATEVLGLPEQQEADQQIAEVKRWLQKHHGWLLIFDNVEDPQSILSTFVPSKHQGSVLITTRRRDMGTLAHSEVLSLFSEDDAVLFLLRRSGLIAKQAAMTQASTDDIYLARELCQLLDRLPLALDQAGAYIAENGGSLKSYIDLYHKYRPIILDRRNAKDQPSHHNVSDHPDSVLMTFWLSLEQIQQRNTFAGRVLQFCAFLAPDQIPEKLVIAGLTDMETEGSNALEMDEALGLLHRYSLIERTEQILSLHRLVQEVIQEVLSVEERHQWMGLAVLVVNAFFPSGEYGTWAQCEFLLPHALTCTKWTLILKNNKFEGAQLLSNTGRYLYERALYREAETFWKLALINAEEQLGASHPYTASRLSNLAAAYRKQGRYAEAEPLYQRALTIAEEQLGASHPQTAAFLTNLADLYESQGRYAEAEPLLKRALTISEEQLGASHPQLAFSLNNLADLYRAQAHYAEAEPLYQRALTIHEEQLGASHPDTGLPLNNLGLLYWEQGRYAEAEPLLKRALAITEDQFGSLNLDTASCLNNLATLYGSQGRYEEAESLLKRVLAIDEEQLGASHPDTAFGLNSLATLYWEQGRYAEAEPLMKRALTIAEEQLGASHPKTASFLNNLAALYESLSRYMEAESLYQRALTIAEEQLGASHPKIASFLTNLANLYESQGRYAEAEPLMKRAVQLTLSLLGIEHSVTQQLMHNYLKILSEIYTNGNIDDFVNLIYTKQEIIKDEGKSTDSFL